MTEQSLTPKQRARLGEIEANLWNGVHKAGTPVTVTKDLGEQVETVTTSAAFVSAAGDAVIFLKGVSGFYLLERVKAR